jgi:glycosyltransferase involved in cell wall biosynthesis
MKIFTNNSISLLSFQIIKKEIYSKYPLITKFFFIIIFLITILLDLFSSNAFSIEKYSPYLEKRFDSIDIAFNKSKNFLKNCMSYNLLKFNSSNNFQEIKVSVVIPMYNCEDFILRAVKSVQFQNITNIEIILVDDNSTDNTLSIVANIMKADKRIHIIKNKNNMGVLFSRSIGVLSSKGEFIFTLDNDDMFLNYDIFDTITRIGEEGKFDIVEFKGLSNKYFEKDLLNAFIVNSNLSHIHPMVLFQPELGRFPIFYGKDIDSYGARDIYLWGKCIRTKIYKTALNIFGYDRYSRFLICYEDTIVNYIIFNTAESFIFIEKYGIYHIYRPGSGSIVGKKKVHGVTNLLYLIDAVFDFSQNSKINKKLVSHLIINLLQKKNIQKTLSSNNNNMKLIISCIKRIINSQYISNSYKHKIKRIIKNFQFISSI